MSQANINHLLDIWYSSFLDEDLDRRAPFMDRKHLLSVVDCIEVGDAPWNAFSIRYNGVRPERNVPKWMTDEYLVCYRDPDLVVDIICDNPDFDEQFDYIAFKEFNLKTGGQIYSNYMSGGFAFEQSVMSRFCLQKPLISLYELDYRIFSAEIPRTKARHLYRSLLAKTRPLSLSQLGRMTSTRFIYLLEMFIILYVELIGTPSW